MPTDILCGARPEAQELRTDESEPIVTWAETAWVRVNQGFPRTKLNLPQGFGVEFKLTRREDKPVIAAFIEQMPEDAPVES